MTDEEIAAILARAEAATPGPWEADGVPYNISDPVIVALPGDVYIAQTVYDMQSGTIKHNVDEDTLFIAAARSDVPALVAEVRRLNTLIEGLEVSTCPICGQETLLIPGGLHGAHPKPHKAPCGLPCLPGLPAYEGAPNFHSPEQCPRCGKPGRWSEREELA
jgi:hypothetical protein